MAGFFYYLSTMRQSIIVSYINLFLILFLIVTILREGKKQIEQEQAPVNLLRDIAARDSVIHQGNKRIDSLKKITPKQYVPEITFVNHSADSLAWLFTARYHDTVKVSNCNCK